MKILNLIFLLIVLTTFCSAQFLGSAESGFNHKRISNNTCLFLNTNPFSGGNSDGHSNRRISNNICLAATSNPFTGGGSDGHAFVVKINSICPFPSTNPFAGGISDGHSNKRIGNIVCTVSLCNPFTGGIADGHSHVRKTNSTCAVSNTNLFQGGMADGHGNSRKNNTACPLSASNPFAGGNADGHANRRKQNILCVAFNTNPFRGGAGDGYNEIAFSACSNNPLPVEMILFDCYLKNKTVELYWETASELNNNYFIIQKGSEGNNYEDIGKVNSKGNSTQVSNYTFTDNNPLIGISWYRLKQTDLNGLSKISRPVKINYKNDIECKVFPNPSNDQHLNIKMIGKKDEEIFISVYGAGGKKTYSATVLLEKNGENTIGLDLFNACKPGIYLLLISNGRDIFEKKITLLE